MFLSGALDDAPKHAPPPPTPKIEGPAWGGSKTIKGDTSFCDIQNEQSKIKETTLTRPKDRSEDSFESASNGQFRSSSFVLGASSSPVAVVPARGVPASGVRSTPPWSSSGTSPVLSRPLLREIQKQQEKQQSISHSPKTRTSGFSIASCQGSPSDSGGPKESVPNCWFKPEIDAPSSIRSIQIEEKAMKDLKRFYSSVKLVKMQPQGL